MQRVIENFPEFKKGERNTSKHFNILEELRKLVDSRNLYDISELEQDLVSGAESKNKHFKATQELLEKEGMNKLEAFRIVLLYTLRYENDDTARQLKSVLKNKFEISESKIAVIESLLAYAGKSRRKGDLFKEASSITNNAKKLFGSVFGGDVKNVLLQHKSWLTSSILEQFSKGKLDQMQYPLYSDNGQEEYDDQRPGESSCKTLIVFMVGGVTYEEAKEIAQFGKVPADQQKQAPQGQLQQIAGSAQQIAGTALSNLGT